jgi:Transposase DDE domain
MWADTGYNGKPLARYARVVAAVTVEVVARTSPHSFRVLRRRWVVERTFGWLMRYRRPARDHERTTASSEAMICWATVIIMTRRPARYENGHPRSHAGAARQPPPAPASRLPLPHGADCPAAGARRRAPASPSPGLPSRGAPERANFSAG